jgi:hypothetical protein
MRKEFEVHMLNDLGLEQARIIGEIFSTALDRVEMAVGGRELAIVATKLQEACFFAKRGIALNPDNQKKDA